MTYPLSTPLSEAIRLAEDAGACEKELRVLRALNKPGVTLADLAGHARAPYWIRWFASAVIGGRWPEGEAAILASSDAFAPCWYARHVIRGRWPEGEARILAVGDARAVHAYARYVTRGRWPEGEEVILASGDELATYSYARYVIGGRWPEGEQIIAKDRSLWAVYVARFNAKESTR